MCMGRVRYTLIFFHGNNINSIQMYVAQIVHKAAYTMTTHLVGKMLAAYDTRFRLEVNNIGTHE